MIQKQKTMLEKLIYIEVFKERGFAILNKDCETVLLRKQNVTFRFDTENEFWKDFITGNDGEGLESFFAYTEKTEKRLSRVKKVVMRCIACGGMIYKQSFERHGGICVRCRHALNKRKDCLCMQKTTIESRVIYIADVLPEEKLPKEPRTQTLEELNELMIENDFYVLVNHKHYQEIKEILFLRQGIDVNAEKTMKKTINCHADF